MEAYFKKVENNNLKAELVIFFADFRILAENDALFNK